ncbi:endonuclease/exonuclease/phosphatase family protein [Hymenobacter properus]|uniref:Endonuclease/exonuclease/phosphatase domain-containing protein n=1 Tax=Hymenobacter properus TaxID=2791026 RepID=A0A931FLK1_9BACT|nr:endonuclease/exonuclease/phosphatase family protein [Hymenobacter properus]MBF9144298.1 hypothetical protein [Hymenobacter properus]MBR7723116.1 hypothetical protein [Microvirga sp. SRT04]
MPIERNLLFWNTKGRDKCILPLQEIVKNNRIDILLLAECPADTAAIASKIGLPFVSHSNAGLTFFAAMPELIVVNDQNIPINAQLAIIPDPANPDPTADNLIIARLDVGDMHILLAGVHLPSKWQGRDANTQANFAEKCRRYIQIQEGLQNINQTIIFGDFNMHPYEMGMTDSKRGFRTISSSHIAHRRNTIGYRGITRRYFYNPCWTLFGDFIPNSATSRPPGTYYRSPQNDTDTYWNCLDGVLVSPEAIPRFVLPSLEVITNNSSVSHKLYDGKRLKPGYSDHLPITFTLTY